MRNKDVLMKLKNLPDNTKEYVDGLNNDKADILSFQNVKTMSKDLFSKNFLITQAKLSDIISFEEIKDSTVNADYKSTRFNCNIQKSLDKLNDFDELYFSIKYKVGDQIKTFGKSTPIKYGILDSFEVSDAVNYKNDKIKYTYLDMQVYPNKKCTNITTKVDDTSSCVLEIGTGICPISQADVDAIKNGVVSVYLRRKNYLPLNNTAEFIPTDRYHPATKRYVDNKFAIDGLETILTVPKAELDKCNDSGYGMSPSQNLNIMTPAKGNYIYYACYGDIINEITYFSNMEYGYTGNIYTCEDGQIINLCMDFAKNNLTACNTAKPSIKNYVFTNDLIIKGKKILNANEIATKKYVDDVTNTLVKKDTNKYVLICNDDTLIIKKDSITDITDATVTIDNLTGKFGTLVANDDGTYSYTLNTIMTDVETFTFKVSNVEQKLVIVPYKEMTYDDSNAGITYDDKWSVETDKNHYKGSAHKISEVGSYNFIMKGTGFKLISKVNNQTGFMSVNAYRGIGTKTDDGKNKPIVLLNWIDTASDVEMYKANIFDNNKLSFDTYTIKINGGAKGSTGFTTCYTDSIIIYNTLGTELSESIRKLYYKLDNSIGVLRTDKENCVFNPTRLYDPTTKKYVDDLVKNSTAMCTDKEIDNMLNEVLGGDYNGN